MEKFNIDEEIRDIRRLIGSACVLETIRREIHAALKGKHVVVIGGEHAESHIVGAKNYDAVVLTDDACEIIELLARRVRKVHPEMNVEKMANNVIGITSSRRGGQEIDKQGDHKD